MPGKRKPTADGTIRCATPRCNNTFAPRFAGQKCGSCDACCAERRRLRDVHRRPVTRLTDAENDELRYLERITKRVGY